MAKIQHPWQVGPTELIEFALEHMYKGNDVDRRLAFLILDVGVETMFKTYLTLPGGVVPYQINRKERDIAVNGNFHELLDGVQKSNPEKAAKFNFAHIQHYHRLRNMLYHEGNQVTAVPMHQLEGYARLAVNALKSYLDVDLSKKLKPAPPQTDSTPTDQGKMLAKCTPEAAEVFKYILESAVEQGHVIYWGTVGFSIRVPAPGSDELATITYGFPPDRFQLYFAHLPFAEDKVALLREEILGMGSFKQAPKTLTLYLKPDNVQQARETYALMERRVRELAVEELAKG